MPILQQIIDSYHFSELKAAARLGLVPDPTRQMALIAMAAHNGGINAGLTVAAALAGDMSNAPKFHTEDDYLLKDRKDTKVKRPKNTLSAEESERLAAERWGH